MHHSNNQEDLRNDSNYLYLSSLQKECFLDANVTHSTILPNSTSNVTDPNLYCPRTFDGWKCWDETPAGTTAIQSCPEFIVGWNSGRNVTKRCTENGTWMVHSNTSKPWTNYTTCIDVEDLNFRYTVNDIYVTGYSISLVLLLLSLMIFFYFRSLQCTRIRIHIHLFLSIILNNILWIIWYKTVVNHVKVIQKNEVFVNKEVAMRWFNFLGWGLSFIITTIYSIVRYNLPGQTERCWIHDSNAFWIIIVPVIISLMASFVFLLNVLRIICTRLHPVPNQSSTESFKRAVRAALILIPLFGLHFMLIPFRPSLHSPAEKSYQVIFALMTSLQGTCVAVLFCFTNHDIMNASKSKLVRLFRTHEAIPMTGVTGGESLVNTRENAV